MNKEYTHRTTDGMPARILTSDRDHPTHPVIALYKHTPEYEQPVYLTKDLCRTVSNNGCWARPFLTETSPWDDVAIDTPVWVKCGDKDFTPRHFARYENGYVKLWAFGNTSHTAPTGESWISSHSADTVFLEKPADA